MGVRTVVAKALSRGANLGVVANVATLVASSSRERRHDDEIVYSYVSIGPGSIASFLQAVRVMSVASKVEEYKVYRVKSTIRKFASKVIPRQFVILFVGSQDARIRSPRCRMYPAIDLKSTLKSRQSRKLFRESVQLPALKIMLFWIRKSYVRIRRIRIQPLWYITSQDDNPSMSTQFRQFAPHVEHPPKV